MSAYRHLTAAKMAAMHPKQGMFPGIFTHSFYVYSSKFQGLTFQGLDILLNSGALTPVHDGKWGMLWLSPWSRHALQGLTYPFVIPLLIPPQVLLPVSSPYLFPLVYLNTEACSTVQH